MTRRIKLFLTLAFTIIISLLLSIVFFSIKQKSKQQIVSENLKNLKFLKVETKDEFVKTFQKLFSSNNKLIFNFFSPTCQHCQYMATEYLKNKTQLKNINIIMVTVADSSSVAKFSNDYQLNTLPNIILLRDTKFQFYKIFGTATVPSFFIYENQKLVKKIIGETKIENIINPVKK